MCIRDSNWTDRADWFNRSDRANWADWFNRSNWTDRTDWFNWSDRAHRADRAGHNKKTAIYPLYQEK